MEQRKIVAILAGDDHSVFDMFEKGFRELDQLLEYSMVVTATSLETIRSAKPDILFIGLGEKPGIALQLLSVIKSDNRLRSIRVFLYGARIEEEICKMARLLGASGCIERTACNNTFMRELRAMLDPRLLPSYVFMGHASTFPAPITADLLDESPKTEDATPAPRIAVAQNASQWI